MCVFYQFGLRLSSHILCVNLASIQQGNAVCRVYWLAIDINERFVVVRIVAHLHKLRCIDRIVQIATNTRMDILLPLTQNALPALLRNLEQAMRQIDIVAVHDDPVGSQILDRPTLLGEVTVDHDFLHEGILRERNHVVNSVFHSFKSLRHQPPPNGASNGDIALITMCDKIFNLHAIDFALDYARCLQFAVVMITPNTHHIWLLCIGNEHERIYRAEWRISHFHRFLGKRVGFELVISHVSMLPNIFLNVKHPKNSPEQAPRP